MVGVLRGIGYSVAPMLVSLTGACGFRIFLDFYCICIKQEPGDFVSVLSGILGIDIYGAHHLLCVHTPEND